MLFSLLKFFYCFFFFHDTATTEIYTLSLHDALPICRTLAPSVCQRAITHPIRANLRSQRQQIGRAHSELQSPCNLVCRLLLEKKKIALTFTTANNSRSPTSQPHRISLCSITSATCSGTTMCRALPFLPVSHRGCAFGRSSRITSQASSRSAITPISI